MDEHTTATKTETELLDRLNELGFEGITFDHWARPDLTEANYEWRVAGHRPGHITHAQYAATRYDALSALVALAEQQAAR